MNAAVGHMDGSALMVIGVSAWYPDSYDNSNLINHVGVDTEFKIICAFFATKRNQHFCVFIDYVIIFLTE